MHGSCQYAKSCFLVLTPCPWDGAHGTWVPLSEAGTPYPWTEVAFPEEPGAVTVIPSHMIHHGGGKPIGDKETRVLAFFTISSERLNYNNNAVVVIPPWAQPDVRAGTEAMP